MSRPKIVTINIRASPFMVLRAQSAKQIAGDREKGRTTTDKSNAKLPMRAASRPPHPAHAQPQGGRPSFNPLPLSLPVRAIRISIPILFHSPKKKSDGDPMLENEVIDSTELARRLNVPETWVRSRTNLNRTNDP